MEINDQQYNLLATQVYWVEKTRGDVKYHPTENIVYFYDDSIKNIGQFQVLRALDNPQNGFQAMAVSPFLDGVADTSQIVLAYAGTNFHDSRDRDTDLQMIALGRTQKLTTGHKLLPLLPLPIPFTGYQTEAQAKSALAFAQEVAKAYPGAHITTTGHSLGQSLAMYVALKQGYQNVGYNGPDIHRMISAEEVQHMRQHPEQFINYRNPYDPIGGIMGNRTQTAHHVRASKGLFNPFAIAETYHGLANWRHDESGRLIDCQNQVVSADRAPYLAPELGRQDQAQAVPIRQEVSRSPQSQQSVLAEGEKRTRASETGRPQSKLGQADRRAIQQSLSAFAQKHPEIAPKKISKGRSM